MAEPLENDDLDTMLRQAMRARPEPHIPTNLASRAMIMAAPANRAIRELARVRRLNRFLTSLAAVLIVGLAVWVFHAHFAAGGFQPWVDTSGSNLSDVSTMSANTSDSSTTLEWMYIGATAAVGAIVMIVMQRTLGGNDERDMVWTGTL